MPLRVSSLSGVPSELPLSTTIVRAGTTVCAATASRAPTNVGHELNDRTTATTGSFMGESWPTSPSASDGRRVAVLPRCQSLTLRDDGVLRVLRALHAGLEDAEPGEPRSRGEQRAGQHGPRPLP